MLLDFGLLDTASASLLGYFVHTWYRNYLRVISDNLRQLHERGLIRSLVQPTELGTSVLFDFNALNLERTAYINGIYFYILSCHKAANYALMNRYDGKQVLYLRGYDFESAVWAGADVGVGLSTVDTTRFTWKVGKKLAPDFQMFRVLSPKDVYWDTADAQRYFYGDFADIIPLASYPIRSIYLNALHWKRGVTDLLDRMDHYVVYISSVTESVLWEVDQLDTDGRRSRVTVVFDDEAINRKKNHFDYQAKMHADYGDDLIWSKKEPFTKRNIADLREQLTRRFLLTTPEAFLQDIEEHRQRIAGDSALLPPGQRETWLDFSFHPALAKDKLEKLRDYSAGVQTQISTWTEKGITCLPLFLNLVQLRIFLTLLMGEHHDTGQALAAYSAVMQGAMDYYGKPGGKVGDLSVDNRERHLRLLKDHSELTRHIAMRLLAYGKSHEFDDFSTIARSICDAVFDDTKAAVDQFYESAAEQFAN